LLATLYSEANLPPEPDLLRRIVQALYSPEDHYEKVLAGCVAGDVLLSVLSSDDMGVKEAIFLVSELYLRYFRRPNGEAMGATSERSVHRFWLEMRSVAHWWAAYLVLLRKYEDDTAASGHLCTGYGAINATFCNSNFAAIANSFLTLATSRRLTRRTETLLDRESCWFMTDAPTIPLMSGGLSETERSILAQYRPR